jgi:lipoyl-dependent peroxiredoxin subunit D
MIAYSDTTVELLQNLGLPEDFTTDALQQLERSGTRFIKDLRVNFKNAMKSSNLDEKETALLGLSVAANATNDVLIGVFTRRAEEHGATAREIGEAIACASLLASNNVFYRFRHFVSKEKYTQMPARIKMNIMMKPVTGKEFFELMSIAISAVNGCEMCVNSHEESLMQLESTEERVFDAIRLASIVTSLAKVVY